ncbi:hypothetical protein A7K91_01675 [Paenibacillus oryzae]|uniref:DUF418 domain-containing protein n=1 Tax=Paenibacillus oryzae TaxID=1844972 RepID=A0A1A5Y9Q8_9BACL|nr:DUF418 domain-containing protein [Paenibacillus oryzae]OBR62354.1 hypothetical protein A7K91_01675 [Paenibacillus oryzae]
MKDRIYGLDLARALAILGMIIVNYKIAMSAENSGPSWLRSATELLEGRASALFVLLAGIGVALMTAKARQSGDAALLSQSRSSLFKRALFLLAAGVLLLLLDWSADILHYYAVFLAAGALLISASDRMVLGLGLGSVALSPILLMLFDYGKGWSSSFHEYDDLWTLSGFIRNLLFNGFHPVFPWIGFFLAGLWVGRKGWLAQKELRLPLLLAGAGSVVLVELASWLLVKWTSLRLGHEAAKALFSTKPMPPSVLYIFSGTGSAVVVIIICLHLAERFRGSKAVSMLIHTGQLSLTHYIGHVAIGLGLLQGIGYLENKSLPFTVFYSLLYFAAAAVFSMLWRKKMARGPIELAMRKLC